MITVQKCKELKTVLTGRHTRRIDSTNSLFLIGREVIVII